MSSEGPLDAFVGVVFLSCVFGLAIAGMYEGMNTAKSKFQANACTTNEGKRINEKSVVVRLNNNGFGNTPYRNFDCNAYWKRQDAKHDQGLIVAP